MTALGPHDQASSTAAGGRCPVVHQAHAASTSEPLITAPSFAKDPRRWVFLSVGLGSTALGAIGVVVPGMPTTIFLIIASYCFARSCPVLQRRLLEHRILGPYLKAVAEDRCMPRSAKIASLAMMWTAVSLSCLAIGFGSKTTIALVAGLLALAAIGTGFICFGVRTGRPCDLEPSAGSEADADA